jgi:geranylgeranyl reductase family protein
MQSAPHTFDILIIGAGPAGTAAAVTACNAGLTAAIIDKAKFPRAKLCGGLITGRSRILYREIFGQDLAPALFEQRDRIAFFANGAPLGGEVDSPPIYLTMRWDMDAHLLDMARAAGATDLTGQRIAQLDANAVSATLEDGRTITGRVMIGADGVNSIVARTLFGRAFDPATIGFALETEAPFDLTPQTIRVDLGAADWGYGWRFAKAGSTTIGIGGLEARNPAMKSALAAYRAQMGDDSDTRIKGHFLPFGDYRRIPGRGRVLLAGDAAGLVDPITGEGIAYAMQSGAAAAVAAARSIAKDRPDAALPAYRRALRPIHRALRMACWLRPLMFGARGQRLFHHAFARSAVLKGAYLRLLAGQTEYPAVCALVLRRLPGALWRHKHGG